MLLGIKWYHHVRNDDVRWKTEQPHLSATVQARRLCLFGHIARMPDESDAKQILTTFPVWELEETTGTSPYYVDEDYPAGPGIIEPLPEWSNWRGSESSTLENDVYVWHYALIVMHVQDAPWSFTAVYHRSLPTSHISWQQTETPIWHSRRPRGQLLRHALWRPCIRCGGPKGMEPAASTFTGTRDSWPLQDGIKDLSSLHQVTVPNCLICHTLVMTSLHVMAH